MKRQIVVRVCACVCMCDRHEISYEMSNDKCQKPLRQTVKAVCLGKYSGFLRACARVTKAISSKRDATHHHHHHPGALDNVNF